MARFYGSIQGNRGEATRLGNAQSGMGASVNGWDLGVDVRAFAKDSEQDCIVVTPSGGSNGGSSHHCSVSVDSHGVHLHSKTFQVTIYADGTYKFHREKESGVEQ